MIKKKTKTITLILFAIIVLLSFIGVIFYFGTRYYVQYRMQNAFDKMIREVGKYDYNFPDYSFMDFSYESLKQPVNFSYELESSLIPISIVMVDNLYDVNIYKMDELIGYVSKHREMFSEEKYRHIEINDKDYYIMAREKNTDDKKFYYIFATYPNELYSFLGKINSIFVVLMIISGVILFFASYKVGSSFEKNNIKLLKYFQNVSHELKTPIMSIQGYAEGIQTDVIKNHMKASEIILSESDRMSSLVEEILFLSKIDSGYADKKHELLDINDVVCDCLNIAKQEMIKKQIDFEVHLSDDEINILGNEQQLRKMFMNIISNAVRYGNNLVSIHIIKEGKWVKINIADDGKGIEKKDLPYIFERFYKGEDGQHGIGLAIAKEVVLLHKGKIKVMNNNGAQFQIWLKCKRK